MPVIEKDRPSPQQQPSWRDDRCIVVHDMESSDAATDLSWFEAPATGISAHYVTDRDGSVYRCTAELVREERYGRGD
jgi:N-acetyl-anhydromuramyl-L-alanine amidase AmpD